MARGLLLNQYVNGSRPSCSDTTLVCLSQLTGTAVAAADAPRVGRLVDVCADIVDGRVTGLLVRARGE